MSATPSNPPPFTPEQEERIKELFFECLYNVAGTGRMFGVMENIIDHGLADAFERAAQRDAFKRTALKEIARSLNSARPENE